MPRHRAHGAGQLRLEARIEERALRAAPRVPARRGGDLFGTLPARGGEAARDVHIGGQREQQDPGEQRAAGPRRGGDRELPQGEDQARGGLEEQHREQRVEEALGVGREGPEQDQAQGERGVDRVGLAAPQPLGEPGQGEDPEREGAGALEGAREEGEETRPAPGHGLELGTCGEGEGPSRLGSEARGPARKGVGVAPLEAQRGLERRPQREGRDAQGEKAQAPGLAAPQEEDPEAEDESHPGAPRAERGSRAGGRPGQRALPGAPLRRLRPRELRQVQEGERQVEVLAQGLERLEERRREEREGREECQRMPAPHARGGEPAPTRPERREQAARGEGVSEGHALATAQEPEDQRIQRRKHARLHGEALDGSRRSAPGREPGGHEQVDRPIGDRAGVARPGEGIEDEGVEREQQHRHGGAL